MYSSRIVALVYFASLLLKFVDYAKTDSVFYYNFINCAALDDEFVSFEICRLKLIERNRRSAMVRAKLMRNVTECTFKVRLMKKLTGWRPFLYKLTVEACDFFQNPFRYAVFRMFYNNGKHQSNANHKCPYLKGEIINVNLEEPEQSYLDELLRKFPFEIGRYGVFIEFYSDGKLHATVNTSVTYEDYRKIH